MPNIYSENIFEWNVKSAENTRVRGVPIMVANFPRAVKMDKETDLTIIIRYDT